MTDEILVRKLKRDEPYQTPPSRYPTYYLHINRKITVRMLNRMSKIATEKRIAGHFKISTQMLWIIRKILQCPKERKRISAEEKRIKWNAYMRERRKKNKAYKNGT